MFYVAAAALLIFNAFCILLVVMGLPGTWLMILAAILLEWWKSGIMIFSYWTVGTIILLAVIGEIIEGVAGIAGTRKYGGSYWGAAGAFAGGIAGGIFGTLLVPVPLFGSLAGACAGAFFGTLLAEHLTGKSMRRSLSSGKGAAVGRLYGTVVKMCLASIIWLVIAFGIFIP